MSDLITLTRNQYVMSIREARAQGWDEAVAAMVYTDGTPVDLAENQNPYRDGGQQ